MERGLPQCQVNPVENDQISEAYFTAGPAEYSRQLTAFKRICYNISEIMQKTTDKVMSSIEDDFANRKFDHQRARREKSVCYRIHSDRVEVFAQIGAVLVNKPKGMGISASRVDDQYRYDPYFTFGVPGEIIEDLGDIIEVRIFSGKDVNIYNYQNDKVLNLMKIIFDLIFKSID